MSFFKFVCISVDMSHGSLLATVTFCGSVTTQFVCSVCVTRAPNWLLMAESPWSERWGWEWHGWREVGGVGCWCEWGYGGREGDWGMEGRSLRSNPINWANCAERILWRGGGGWCEVCSEDGRGKTDDVLTGLPLQRRRRSRRKKKPPADWDLRGNIPEEKISSLCAC